MRSAFASLLSSVAVSAALVAGCTSTSAAPSSPGATTDPDPVRFDLEGSVPLTCMAHQSSTPGVDYTDPARTSVFRSLPVLKYYLSNGSKGYCDGARPTANDRAWAQWSADQSTNRAPVAAILDAAPA